VVETHVLSLGACEVRTLTELRAACVALGIKVETGLRASKEPFISALRDFHWNKDHPGKPLPAQVMPMLLGDWADLTPNQVQEIEQDIHAWIVQPKLDGVRALMHIEPGGIRITSRYVSETTFRLSEFQDNLCHLAQGLAGLFGTVLDGELVCPVAAIDTGSTTTATALQATVAVLSTSPENAHRLQERQGAHLRFHAFDILRCRGRDVTSLPLRDRLDFLAQALSGSDNPDLEMVPSFVIGKAAVHRNIIEAGGEGTVWKQVNQPYLTNKRVKYWIKRKRGIEIEAIVSGFKPGNNGHVRLVGAVEFSAQQADGSPAPVAWVTSWTDQDRQAMTCVGPNGEVMLNPSYLGRRALIEGQDHSARSRRLRHARIVKWC
jgi:ATP-dependent DNA ligase